MKGEKKVTKAEEVKEEVKTEEKGVKLTELTEEEPARVVGGSRCGICAQAGR